MATDPLPLAILDSAAGLKGDQGPAWQTVNAWLDKRQGLNLTNDEFLV